MTSSNTGTTPDTPTSTTWPGQWVSDRLGVDLRTTGSAVGMKLPDLVGLAVRRNPRRAHLLVSTVLGKHVPTDPHLVYGAGALLGVLVQQELVGAAVGDLGGGSLLGAALSGIPGAGASLSEHCQQRQSPAPQGTVVVGYAETATALGHTVADQLVVPYLHSTRRPVEGLAPVGGFEEEHSHATSHLLLPEDPAMLAGSGPLVLVDDELSTGTTALNTIAALHRNFPRDRYVIAALVDLRSPADRERMAAVAEDLGVRIDAVALVAGAVTLAQDVLERGAALVEQVEAEQGSDHLVRRPSRATPELHPTRAWPADTKDGGRHGFTPADRECLEQAVAETADSLADRVAGARVHVLGFEELMYTPLRLAQELAQRLRQTTVTYSTTTRSPVLAHDDAGYAIRTSLTFPAHDDPADGPGPRFAYNVASTGRHERLDAVVLVVDRPAFTDALLAPGSLVDQLCDHARTVQVVTVSDYRPELTDRAGAAQPTTPPAGETL